MEKSSIYTCPQLIDYVAEVGFLPLLNVGIPGWSADDAVDEECRYTEFPDGGWEWKLWEWKGSVIRESGCAYGKFFKKKAAFVSREWWPDFCNYRRSVSQPIEEGSIEDAIVETLKLNGSMITKQLRKACGFVGPTMRGKFDAYITKLQMAGHIVTEDFVYPVDKHGREYGFGWALLTTPENLFGRECCCAERSPEESRNRIAAQLKKILPGASDKTIDSVIG